MKLFVQYGRKNSKKTAPKVTLGMGNQIVRLTSMILHLLRMQSQIAYTPNGVYLIRV